MGHDPDYVRRNELPAFVRSFIPVWDEENLHFTELELSFYARQFGSTRREIFELFEIIRYANNPHICQQARLKFLGMIKKMNE